MFQYYDEYKNLQTCEPVLIRDFLNQSNDIETGWFEEYKKYGGIPEIHGIVPHYELPAESKISEYAEGEKEKLLKRIADGAFDYFCDVCNLHNRKDVRRFFKALARNMGDIVSPYKLKMDLSTDETAGSALRDYTVKKYLELLCMNGLAFRLPVYDPKMKKQKINMSHYYFTDVGLARVYKEARLSRRQLYMSSICNKLMRHDVPLYSALYATSVRGEDKKTHRVTKSIDLVVVEDDIVVDAIQILLTDKVEEIKESCHAMQLIGPDCGKTIVIPPSEAVFKKVRLNSPDNIEVTDIITFLSR